jgi:hypothetical protein
LPDPETPDTTVSEPSGIRQLTPARLWDLAFWIRISTRAVQTPRPSRGSSSS